MENNIEKKDKTYWDKNFWLGIAASLMVGVLIGSFLMPYLGALEHKFSEKNMDEKRTEFISEKENIIGELIVEGKYRCCLEKPCTYCIEKSPKHGEGATCNCLADVVEGVHPCGECIGEIMEGHGNPFLAPYFAQSIAEEMGESHVDELKLMMSQKYGIPIEEQL